MSRRRIWGHRFKPGEQFALGWRRLQTELVDMHTFHFGPWEVTLYLVDRTVMPK